MVTRVIILAAGKGKRMGQQIPKALTPLCGMPLISYVLKATHETNIDPKPIIIVSPQGENRFRDALGSSYEYVVQADPLGTGHAVQVAENAAHGADTVMVFNGDQPFLRAESIRNLYMHHRKTDAVLSLATVTVPDFLEWRESFADFGRIVRDENGNIAGIVEKKDATPHELTIRELNPSYFCFNASWLWENLHKLKNQNAQGEYYLTDLLKIAIDEKKHVASIAITPLECIGINTPAQLALAESLCLNR